MDPLLIIIFALIFSAFFSGLEIAFLSSNKLRIELEKKQGKFTSKIVSRFVNAPAKFIATILIGVNVSLVFYGKFFTELLKPKLISMLPEQFHGEISLLIIITVFSTLFLLVFAEFLPKVLFRINPNRTLNFFALIIYPFYILFYPLVLFILFITKILLKLLFKVELKQAETNFGRVDLDHYLQEISTKNEQDAELSSEIQMFQNVLDFESVKVRECMIPRIEIEALSITDSIESLRAKFIQTGLSRILIYRENVDHIIGYAHSFDMFKGPKTIQSILLPVSIIPESMQARDLLTQFMQQRRSIALVVDEHGLTSGIVTIEDVIEEIFGEIVDEHDVPKLIEGKIGENEFIFSGRLEIDYINDKYELEIPEDPGYETLGGFITHHYENIPEPNEQIVIGHYHISIQSVKDNRIDRVKLEINPELVKE
ncbi:MAG: hemolysin family protein [Bacteroidia bacterium]|nr:hemolysin family protein [Bacteroidia bacterium]NNC86485.1 HlyC/CorC family transporter [Bacteroidia bacterium]